MGKLTIQEIAAVLVTKNGLEKREANQFASVMFALIQERLEIDQLVKVKGLGTFKIIDVEARESVSVRTGERVTISGHAKVSFIPDATMKELVNKPFSQFETVVLNDGVEFSDMKMQSSDNDEEDILEETNTIPESLSEEAVNEEPVEEPAPVAAEDVEEATASVVAEVVEEAAAPVAETEVEEPVALMEVQEEQPAPVVETEVEEPASIAEEEQEDEQIADEEDKEEEKLMEEPKSALVSETVEERAEESYSDEEDGSQCSGGHRILVVLGVLALMAASAVGGYYLGRQNSPAVKIVPDTVVVHDTITAPQTIPSHDAKDVPDAEPVKLVPAKEAEKVEPISGLSRREPAELASSKSETATESVDKYSQKDARVRLGAYRIVGLDHEVKVQAGQTFYGICRANLGPDMECYVEVYNDLPSNPTIKEGQIIKIPKLQLKKKRK